jgi:outer membrane receptor protein involved in Fe transport
VQRTTPKKSNLRLFLLLGAASVGTGLSAQAVAQETETVVITGSRIPQTGLYAASPVTSVGQQEIKFSGANTVDSLINALPGASGNYSSTSSVFATNGALGQAQIALRNLGNTRTLVLMDGKRLMPGDVIIPAPDVNQIPAALVDHVEVLTGGAGAVYGSDAVAGVVNFIMRKDFEGIEFDGQYSIDNAPNDGKRVSIFGQGPVSLSSLSSASPIGQVNGQTVFTPNAPSNWWGGQSVSGTVLFGVNTADGRGNVTAWLGYYNQAEVRGGKRDFSNCALATNTSSNAGKSITCAGSSNYNRWLSIDNASLGGPGKQFQTGTGAAGSGKFVPFGTVGALGFYNFGHDADLETPDTRYNGGFNAHYDVNKELELYANLNFADNDSTAHQSPTAIFTGGGTIPVPGAPPKPPGFPVIGYEETNCTNPLMTAQENQFLCGLLPGDTLVTAGATEAAIGHPYWNGNGNLTPGQSLVEIRRRDIEFGDRTQSTQHTAYRMIIGAKGELGDGWTYDAFGQYGLTRYAQHFFNDWSRQRVQNALEVDPLTGKCVTDVGNCVPLDVFNGLGSINHQMESYIGADAFQVGYTEEQVLGANLTGDLHEWGGQSPWAKNPIGVSVGVEYRAEYLEVNTDHEYSSADIFGISPAAIKSVPRSGFSVPEIYAEVRIPVIQEKPWAEDLTFDGAYRYSSYSTAGHATSYKYGVEYQPVDDIRFRAGFNRAVRAPNVVELFAPETIGVFSLHDPCNGATGVVFTNCTTAPGTANVTPAQIASGNLPCPAAQCNVLTQGNPSLKPEVSDTRTVGIVFTPTFLSGFSATVDYYNINVAKYISSGVVNGSTSQIYLDGCYAATANAASKALTCSSIVRGGTGGIYGAGFVSYVNTNLDYIKTSGVDFEVNDTLDLADVGADGWGSVTTNFLGSYLDKWLDSPLPGLGVYNCASKMGSICENVYSRWKSRMRFTWSTPWDVDISLLWRFVGGVSYDGNSSNPLLNSGNAYDFIDAHIRDYNYFDLSATWNVRAGVELRGGVNNIFALEPPVLDQSGYGVTPIPFGNENTYPGTYDVLGRVIFVGATIKY